jgi:mannose-1-phosphate guanylyltransferase
VETGAPIPESPGARRVVRFVEKPDAARAVEFLRAGTFLWNSGMFFFRADAILGAIIRHLPELQKVVEAPDDTTAKRAYRGIPSISIDHGVMEKADRVAVVPGDFGWSDIGSWTTAFELAAKTPENNAVPEGTISADATGNYVHTQPGKLVALVGVHDLVVVDTKDALLVLPRDRAQDVRAIVQVLEQRGDKKHA